MLSFSYYMHEKAEESRHSESMCFMIAVLGSVLMVGGMIQTLVTAQRPEWFFIFPYHVGSSPYDFLGLAFTLLGVTLFIVGIVLAVHYGAQRLWYSTALKERYRLEEERLKATRKHGNSFSPPEVTEEVNPITNILDSRTEPHEAVQKDS